MSRISKFKSAFLLDEIPNDNECVVFGDLLIGLAQNWHSQLSRASC